MKKLLVIHSILICIFSHYGHSKSQFPTTLKLNNKELVLNGVGTRKATWFKVKVYNGALYLTKKTQKLEDVLGLPLPKYIEMKFLRSVEAEKLQGGWQEGWLAAVKKDQRLRLQTKFQKFNSTMENVDKDDKIQLQFLKSGLNILINGKIKALIEGQEFAKALFSIWFINPRDESLRNGMLGIKD